MGELLTPSIVAIDQDGSLLVGRAAKELQVRSPDRCARIFKRFMGSDWTAKIAGKSFSTRGGEVIFWVVEQQEGALVSEQGAKRKAGRSH